MDIQLLWSDDCPNHEMARQLLREVLGSDAFDDIDASDPDVAQRFRFPGSPTIRVNGEDVEPGYVDPGDYLPRCRIYSTKDGLRGVPEREWIEAVIRANGGHARQPIEAPPPPAS